MQLLDIHRLNESDDIKLTLWKFLFQSCSRVTKISTEHLFSTLLPISIDNDNRLDAVFVSALAVDSTHRISGSSDKLSFRSINHFLSSFTHF